MTAARPRSIWRYKFGATEIVLLGYDMTGGHFCKHPLQNPPQAHFRRHMRPLAAFAADARRRASGS
jgi:hypothetical protein